MIDRRNERKRDWQVSGGLPLTGEVLVMPHIFLPDSGHSGGFRCHSSGICLLNWWLLPVLACNCLRADQIRFGSA